MGATTRWKDTEMTDINEVLSKMTSEIPDDSRASVYRIRFRNRKLSEDNKTIHINGENIEYNVIKYGYIQISAQDDPSEDREIPKNGFIVVTKIRGIIYYIVDQNTTAKKLLRKILGYTGKNEIEAAGFDFAEDFFVWLVCKVYNSDELIENNMSDDKKELFLEEIKGIRGNTEDLQTRVATSGESVMNVISTLSFILESRRLNQVILNLKYTEHENIRVKLQKNTVELDRPYLGEFDSEATNEEIYGKVYLLLYSEILPLLEQEYRMNKADDIWNQKAYIDFLQGVKDTVIEKIENKIVAISGSYKNSK